jgi:hypothetical protein
MSTKKKQVGLDYSNSDAASLLYVDSALSDEVLFQRLRHFVDYHQGRRKVYTYYDPQVLREFLSKVGLANLDNRSGAW